MLEAGYLNPPFVPAMDEIHADQQNNIGRPPADDQYARTRLKPDFEEQLKGFDYQSAKVIQEEIVEVLQKVSEERRKSEGLVGSAVIPFDFTESKASSGTSCLSTCTII